MNKPKPLWTCPKCKQTFVTRNIWHSCVRLDVNDFFKGSDPKARKLYDAFLNLVSSFGPVKENRVKGSINFQARVRFAGISRITKNGLVCGFWLKRKIKSPRFTKTEFIPPNNYIYRFLLRETHELDNEVKGWLGEAYSVGQQKSPQARN